MKDRKLGRGLEFLLGDTAQAKSEDRAQLELNKITSNPFQPRKEFVAEEIETLANSIRREGLLQPILVRRREHGFELIAGERRLRACRALGWSTIPASVIELSDSDMLHVALAENILRRDLNPIERALAFAKLQADYHLTHEEIGSRLGMDRSTVTNLVRLLELPEHVKGHVSRGTLSMGHARALLSLTDRALQDSLCNEIVAKGLSVREVERRARSTARPPRKLKADVPEALLRDLEQRIQGALAAKVMIRTGRRKGKIIIEYYGAKDLDRIVSILSPLSEPNS